MQQRLTAPANGTLRQPELRNHLAANLQRAFPINDAGSFAAILTALDEVPASRR